MVAPWPDLTSVSGLGDLDRDVMKQVHGEQEKVVLNSPQEKMMGKEGSRMAGVAIR